eukprot:scaffold3786_cov336-Prasinococcus_capsulatus_cf.AAC.5
MANRTDPLARVVHGTNPQNLIGAPPPLACCPCRRCCGGAATTSERPALVVCACVRRGDPAAEDLRLSVLEGEVLRPHRRVAGGPRRRAAHLRRHAGGLAEAHGLRLPGAEDAADPARQGHRGGVHQERGLQVRAPARRLLPPPRRQARRGLPVPGAPLQRLPQGGPAAIGERMDACVRLQRHDGGYELKHIDEFIEELLTKDYSLDIALPRLPKRWTLEATGSTRMTRRQPASLCSLAPSAAVSAARLLTLRCASLQAHWSHG